MKAKTVFLTTALAGALAAASAAQAATDVKVYPGSACQAVFGSDAADLFTSGFIQNLGAADVSVACPIVRDNHANLNGVKSVGVRVRSLNGTTIHCSLESRTALGVLVTFNSNSTANSFATNLALDIDASTKGGTYGLLCLLPPNGEVLGYRVTEFEI